MSSNTRDIELLWLLLPPWYLSRLVAVNSSGARLSLVQGASCAPHSVWGEALLAGGWQRSQTCLILCCSFFLITSASSCGFQESFGKMDVGRMREVFLGTKPVGRKKKQVGEH